jgi:V8-like Glu-specific endopeptidase
MRWAGLLVLLVVAGCRDNPSSQPGKDPEPLAQSQSPVIYGTDNRTDVVYHPDSTLRSRATDSTVALMHVSDLVLTNPDSITYKTRTLGEIYNLCSGERFRDDPAPAFCTGTLIDDDLVLTAGHCLPSAEACASTRFVFRFYRYSYYISAADVFSCQDVVVRAQGVVNGKTLNYAIARLDRSAIPRYTPAPVRAGNRWMPTGQPVALIGASGGTPLKIDSTGKVLEPRAVTRDYFVASLDAFHGDTGAGVYELEGYSVAGILVRGDKDYATNGNCRVARVCGETGCRGEEISYVRPAIEAYCQAAVSSRLCPPAVAEPPPRTYDFVATNTHSAQQDTVNKKVMMEDGSKLTVGTCGQARASASGDTFLRVFGPDGAEVASNDDACSSRGSQVVFQVVTAGEYEIRVGCHGDESCSGTVSWDTSSRGSRDYSASNTSYANQNTTNWELYVLAGMTLDIGTCGVTGASGWGDTLLRLYGPTGNQVASSDDACGGLSRILYTVPAGGSGTYQVRAGCYSNYSCGGTVAWSIQ